MVPILKMRRFSCLLRLPVPPGMGEMAQIFISEIEWLAALKCRATSLSTSLFLTERRCSANLSDRRRGVKLATFTARNAIDDVGGGACKIVLNNEILSEFFQYNDDFYGDFYGDLYGDFYGDFYGDTFVATNFLIFLFLFFPLYYFYFILLASQRASQRASLAKGGSVAPTDPPWRVPRKQQLASSGGR